VKDIIDHPWIGAKVKYRRGVGTIVAARTGGQMIDLETGEMTDDTVQFRIKPDSDGRAFWTCTYVNSPVPGKAFL